MQLNCLSFGDQQPIPEEFAFGKIDPVNHFAFSENRNPGFSWSDVPANCRSLVLVCIDVDVPTVGDDVNQEGRTIAKELPRTEFAHWGIVDLSPTLAGIEAGSCSWEVTPGGQQSPPGPSGTRQALNDYTGWFANDPDMAGNYFGYDGPAPPWNDERLHHYQFRLYATDLEKCPVADDFTVPDVLAAIKGHVLAETQVVGTYTLNPNL